MNGEMNYVQERANVATVVREMKEPIQALVDQFGKSCVIEAMLEVLDYQDVNDWIKDNS